MGRGEKGKSFSTSQKEKIDLHNAC